MPTPLRLIVLISGNGSNLQSIIDSIKNEKLNANIAYVISNNESAYGLQRAIKADIPTKCIDHRAFKCRDEYDQSLGDFIESHRPDLIILAGYMRILGSAFVERFEGKILNIHPSLLPKYKGLNTHARAISAGETQHGCTVHIVTPELDAGPIILQGHVEVSADDTPESLQTRVQQVEHSIYPKAIAIIAKSEHPSTTT